MRKLIFSIASILAITLAVRAGNTEKEVSSTIKKVTVFQSGAQLTRTTTATVNSGITEVVFTNLSDNINQQSIQVSGKGRFTIMGVKHRVNYLRSQQKSKAVIVLEDSLKMLKNEMELQKAMQSVYNEEKSLLLTNKNIGGQQTGVKITELKEAADFFRQRLSGIETKQLDIKAKIIKLQESIARISNQLESENANRNKPIYEIVVTLLARERVTAFLTLTYYTTSAGWQPLYDLRATDINNPVELNFKANVYQSTGENWENVNLTLCSGNPTLGGTPPFLRPWYLSFYTQRAGRVSKMAAGAVEEEVMEYKVPAKAKAEEEIADFTSFYTAVNEAQTRTYYEISIPYYISGDGKQQTIAVQDYKLPAEYNYYCVPKLDRDVFLLAKVTGWEQYNLITGEASIFFEGTYVGKSMLDTRSTKDTLEISLGRDENIIVTRTKMKQYSGRQFLGNKRVETIAFEISARNKKKQDINLVIEDQLPVSRNSEIEVQKSEISGAEHNEDTGKLTWRLTLKPAETKKYNLKYTVKYPKDRVVVLE